MRLWSAHGEFIGECHYASVNLLFLDIIDVHAYNINLDRGAAIKVEMLLFMGMFNSVRWYTWMD